MAILLDNDTRVVIQGITGAVGQHVALRMQEDGYTQLVAGVTPGKGGTEVHGCPVYDSVVEAKAETGANTSLILVPAAFAKDAALEAISAGMRVVSVYSEGIPVFDALLIIQHARTRGCTLIGPNAAGIAAPGVCNLSEFASENLARGSIGIVSKSGTLTYDLVRWLSREYKGISTVACLGGDIVRGLAMVEAVRLFGADEATEAIVILGEIGGLEEVHTAEELPTIQKPVFAYVSGQYAPPERAMGHAGAIQSGVHDSAAYKLMRLRDAGAHVATCINMLPIMLKSVLR